MSNENDIIKILNGSASREEKIHFYKELENDESLRQVFYETRNLWAKSAPFIPLPVAEKKQDFDSLWGKILNISPKRHRIISLRNIAAILLIAVLVGGASGYLVSVLLTDTVNTSPVAMQHYVSRKGSITEIALNDGSTIILNSGSELSYYEDHKTKERIATLTGEALFNVIHNKKKPFIISVGGLKIVDIGTKFNVKAYSDDNFVETTLVEGKIDLVCENKKIVTMSPSQQAIYLASDNRIELSKVDANFYTAWVDNKFVFRNARLSEIMKELGRWYGVKVQIDNEAIANKRFHITLMKSTAIGSVMKMLKLNSGINYTIQEKEQGQDIIIIN